jgi:diguanylate cyclase (GGDEF)-like protein
LLALIEQLAGEGSALESPAELFPRAFGTLLHCVAFDVGLVVMIEQNLELHITTRAGGAALVSEELIERTRATLRMLFPMSFETTEVVVVSERNDLPARSGEADTLRYEMHALLSVQNRTAGVLLLYRGDAPFRTDEQQIAAIAATQVSMLLGNLRSRERILNMADTDDLTGIWNKRFFRRQLPQEIERARVYSVPLSLLLFDLDDFKQINDGFGHTVGDVVLSELCGAVREMLRPPDLFARFGGDEFAIILPHTDLTGAVAVAQRILKRIEGLTIPTDEEGFIRPAISIGVAEFRAGEDASANDLVRRADERLYESKRIGKNRYTA